MMVWAAVVESGRCTTRTSIPFLLLQVKVTDSTSTMFNLLYHRLEKRKKCTRKKEMLLSKERKEYKVV
jgi:hypothetical protein